jgi:hypothetical protein
MVASAEAMEDFYIMPAVGSIIVADSGNEQQRQKNVRDFALRFQSAMNEVVGTCTVCKASGSSDDKHRFSSSCSYVRGRCLGCLSNEHFITKQFPCPNKLKFATNVGICFRCGLSNRIQQVILHPNRMSLYAPAVLYLTNTTGNSPSRRLRILPRHNERSNLSIMLVRLAREEAFVARCIWH